MMDDQLAVAAEQLGEPLLSCRSVEDILLLDLHPRQRAPLRVDQIAHPGERLLVFQMRLARGKPFLMRDDFWWLHAGSPMPPVGRRMGRRQIDKSGEQFSPRREVPLKLEMASP